MSILDDVIAENYGTKPQDLCRLLMALAGTADAKKGRTDTILIGAAKMIEAFERRTRGDPDEADGIVRMGDMG